MLHALVDGEIDPADRVVIERDIAADHDSRTEIEAWRRQKDALKLAYGKVLDEEVPPAIKAALRTRAPWRQPPWQLLAAAAAAVVAVLAGLYAFSDVLRPDNAGEEIAENALSAHVVYSAEVRHPVEVQASDRDHLVAWLSKRIGHKIDAPDLSSKGFELVGGRLLHESGYPAAQFMYEDANKRRLTIYVAHNPTNRETAFRVEEKSTYTTCYWLDGDSGYAVAAELPASDMLPIARLVYDTIAAGS